MKRTAVQYAAGVALLAVAVATAVAQTHTPVSFSEDFQSYGKSKKPNGWIDGKVGDLSAKPRGYYKTHYDPLGDKKGPNVVFGSHKSTGSEDDEKNGKRIGWMSTYADKTFAAAGRFEFQGRMIEMHKEARIGLVVLSGYPDTDRYYLILDKRNAQGNMTMQLTSFGAGTPTGTVDSNLVIEAAKWYRFRISTDDVDNVTRIRARFWRDGTPEPSTYQIDAADASPNRLKTGHLGMWAGGGKDNDDGKSDDDNQSRGVYIDDLTAQSPSDTTAPLISFYESGTKLDPPPTPAFNRDARIEIRISDDLSTFTSTALLDGQPYTSLTPVGTEGTHTLTVRAVDAPGNVRDATLTFLVDKTRPVIGLLANGTPLVNGTVFSADVTLSATIQDLSGVQSSAALNGTTVTLPLPVAEERAHQISVEATDAANNTAAATGTFTVDKSAPVISVLANGSELASGAWFRDDVTLAWSATDLTLDQVTATLDNAPVQPGKVVSVEGVHTLVVTARDRATHTTTLTRTFSLAKNAPEVRLLANGAAFEQDSTYNTAVRFTAVVNDPTPTAKAFTVDGASYNEGDPVTGDGSHTVKVVVTNAAQLSSTVGPFNFVIDTTPPVISMTESGQPFADGTKFTRDVLPVVTATDALTPNPTIVVTLNGTPYPTNASITEERREHVIRASATDAGGNAATTGPFRFMLDKTRPVVTIVNAATGEPFPGGALFNTAVAVKVTVTDVTQTTAVATLGGQPFNLGAPAVQADGSVLYTPAAVVTQGSHVLSVVATDEVGLSNEAVTAAFVIDTTPPAITFTDPAPNATVGSLTIIVGGTADDAQTITINGRAAQVNTAARTFTIADVTLLEGANAIDAVAFDAAGNRGTATMTVQLDTRAPGLTMSSPAADACIDATTLQVTGTASDPHLGTVTVTVGSATPVVATVNASTGSWTAAVPIANEGRTQITVEATDQGGHSTSVSRSVVIDRTAPVIEISSDGNALTAAAVNRKVSLFVRAVDADPSVTLSLTLDGASYASGTPVATEGQHTLAATATDCAGHTTQKSAQFTVDLTAPTIRNLSPANGATVGTMPSSIAGVTDTDVVNVVVTETALLSTPGADGSFTIAAVPFAEGLNRFALVATDRAGNSSTLPYAVTVKTAAPVVEIRESGVEIPANALFNRGVTPLFRSVEPATLAATLNGAAFSSGTTITADGSYTLRVTATDALGHVGTAEATFKIDRTPPVVTITTPVTGTVQTDQTEVRGNAGDAIAAAVNGLPVTLAPDGSFVVSSLLLEVGVNAILATGRDQAGNTGRAEVIVTRDDLSAGILLTYPPDLSRTNRPATDVIGRVLTPGRGTTVRIGTTDVPVDSTGGFRLSGYALVEGANTITATATATNGRQTAVSTRVTADLTPPSLAILESNQPLTDGARFPERAVITLQAADSAGAVTTDLTIDGANIATAAATIAAAGGHSVVALARDLAGNETRAERTFFIGSSSGGTSDCRLEGFDPADGSVVLSSSATLAGRSGGAIGVKVNGVSAIVADGAFYASVELPAEGANVISIRCTDANGTPTGDPSSITLQRVTGAPSISIDTPAENFASAQETIAVTGTVGPGVVSADVNGVAATITGTDVQTTRPFTVSAVRLSAGLNVLVAHGRNAAGRIATASRRGLYLKELPAISISSPSSGTTTGASRIAVSGTWSNLDPATLVLANSSASVQFTRSSDTSGAFVAPEVPLSSGPQTLTVNGRDRLNRAATASVAVTLVAGAPSIAISQPANHAAFGGGSANVTVSGTFQAASGSNVDVNGVTAVLSGASYSAVVTFSTLAGGITPIVARVTEPSGASASTSIVVTQLVDAPEVVESFPAANAVEVDGGAMILVLFSQPMDGATLATAFRLEDGSGAPVSGTLHADKDVLTFAPATMLTNGASYTLRVSSAAKNVAGTPLAAVHASSFTVAGSAPSTAPVLTAIPSAICGQSIVVQGTASPGARVRLETGTLTLNVVADPTGKFSFTIPISGQSGFALVRVRLVGSDGSISPAAELQIRIDCSGPQVLNASYDRSTNRLTIQFSEPVDASTVNVGAGNAVLLTLTDGRTVAGAASVTQGLAIVTPAEDLSAKSFTLTVTTAVKDLLGNRLVSSYSQNFEIGGGQPPAGDGSGFISGEVYDATTGRPLAGVAMTIDVAATQPVTTSTDARGRYLARMREGAHTIRATAGGYTTVWREILVPPGAGVIPIDIRMTRRGEPRTSDGSAITLTHGGDTTVTRRVDLTIPAGVLGAGRTVALTAAGSQALTGLLPLGWSPLSSAEVTIDGSDAATSIAGAQLTFFVPAADLTAAAQNLTAVQYGAARDEWNVIQAVVVVGTCGTSGCVTLPVAATGAYALVYPDKGTGVVPPLPATGDVLRGVSPAASDAPALVRRDFTLDPPLVLPSGRAVATLRIEGTGTTYPSGTAVQAYIDEELRLADGSTLLDPPFATDLLLYRTLSGDQGVAAFHLAPTERAAQVVLETGVDHIRVFPYPGRLDRGTLIGSEGGRVPADDKVAVDIATGAVAEPLRATAASLSASELAAVGTVAGFRVVGGFGLTLQRATEPPPIDLDGDGQPDSIGGPELFIPARVTYSVAASTLPGASAQVILVELLDQTPYGRMLRLSAPMMPVDSSQTPAANVRFVTKSIDRSILPVDGVMREGRYILLAAETPIAFATGTVSLLSATGRLLSAARVLTPPFGVADLSRATGIYNIPIPAKPAAPFSLVPRHTLTGDGVPYTATTAPDPDAVVRVDLALVPQPPLLGQVVVLKGDPPSQGALSSGGVTADVAVTTNVRASFTPAIDPTSVTSDSITVTDAVTGVKVSGAAAADGSVAVVWTLTAGERLKPNGRYTVAIKPSIRGTNGASLARGATYTFATVTQILNSEIHRERIRITIPDANGLSLIVGTAGALPAGWQAVAVRRQRDFNVRYQATAASDGAFSFTTGNGGNPADKVTIADLIDLQVINTAGNVAAIFPLTPFASEDGKSFVAPVGQTVRFTTPEGFTMEIPAGAFDLPTVVTVSVVAKEEFLVIPSLEAENNYIGSVRVDFEGIAKKPLKFEAPVPAGLDTAGRQFILAEKGMSARGPRLAVIDLLNVENGKFVTDDTPILEQNAIVISSGPGRVGTNQTLTGSKASKYLRRMIASGIFMYLDIKVPVGGSVGWGVMEGLQAGYDLMWDIFASYYIPHIHIYERGGALIPVITGRPFTVIGVDPGTGMQAFSRTYDPIPFGPPGTVVPVDSAEPNYGGPYPVFGSPFRVEMVDLDIEEVVIRSVRNFLVSLENDQVTVVPGSPALPGDTKVQLLNVTNGTMISGTAGSSLQLSAKRGQRIVLLIEEHDVEATTPLSVVFSEPIYTGTSEDPGEVDTFLHNLLKVEYAQGPAGPAPSFSDITAQVRFTTDSGNRRIRIETASALQSEALYRITLKPDIADIVAGEPGLKLGQGAIQSGNNLTPVGGGQPLVLLFDVSKPAGEIASFSTGNVWMRGMELSGNVLVVAAANAGMLSFDMSNPTGTPAPLGSSTGGLVEHYALTIDRHGRVFSTAQQPMAGVFRSYRVEDFAAGGAVPIIGSTLISWRMGYSQMMGLPSNTMISDRPEAIPIRIKVALQDDEREYASRQDFVNATGAAKNADYPDDLQRFTVTLSPTDNTYRMQRITVENVTMDMRWSGDAKNGAPAVLQNVVARSTDKLRVVYNLRTYAVVALLGYGIGVYDANAIESNGGVAPRLATSSPGRIREQLVLTAGHIARQCPNATPDYGIIENYITTDAELRGESSGEVFAYFTDNYRGVLDLRLRLPGPNGAGTRDDECEQRPSPNAGGLLFRSTPSGSEVPRIAALKSALPGNAFLHFTQLARLHWAVSAQENAKGVRGTQPNTAATRDYLLVAGGDAGVIVVDIDGNPPAVPRWPLEDANVADVIWIPGGALSVRVVQSANVALVGDRQGRAILVDLSRIDERWDDQGNLTTGLFPTVSKSLAGAATGGGIGSPDPRILWMSPPGIMAGTIPPVFDPHTGMVYAGGGNQVKVFSAFDPRLRVKVNLGEAGLSDVGGVVPLGIAAPQDIQQRIAALPACDGSTLSCRENASLGAFRLEVALPGNMVDALTGSNNELRLAIESERVAGAITEQTPNGFPRSHLRRTRRDGSSETGDRAATSFMFRRIIPEELRGALKMQRGYNRFISPWIVAIADPRASEKYQWSGANKQQKKEAGCEECERPKHLLGKTEADGVYELWTNGRFVAVRPELIAAGQTIFDGSAYGFLGQERRLVGRFTTIMADTVRPTEALVAAQNAPAADGLIYEHLLLHSGELQSESVDLDAGGRSGFNVVFDRHYSSRTLGGSFLGQGWDSSLFRRLRALPNGDVEYRDENGEVWRFTSAGPAGGYQSPKGLFLKLSRTQRGWKVIDQQWRIAEFDDLGRLLSETDQFYKPDVPDSGNLIRYAYDESGRLRDIIDPVRRQSSLSYWSEAEAGAEGAYPGLVKKVVDWRDRSIEYAYDKNAGTLTKAQLPQADNISGGRPALEYGYATAGGNYNDSIELRSNLESVTAPHEAATGGAARATFTYGTGGATRDRMTAQQWATGESVAVTYDGPTDVTTTDALGLRRKYTLSEQPKDSVTDRAHVKAVTEIGVTTSSTPFGSLPDVGTSAMAGGGGSVGTNSAPSTSSVDRNFTFDFDTEGLIKTSTFQGVATRTATYKNVQPEAPGWVLSTVTTTPLAGPGEAITQTIEYQNSGPNTSTFVAGVRAGSQRVESPEPHRNSVTQQANNSSIVTSTEYTLDGQVRSVASSGGTDSTSPGASTSFNYAGANDAKHKRGLILQMDSGSGMKTEFDYPGTDQMTETDARGVVLTTEYDPWRRPRHVTAAGPNQALDETYKYDATGNLAEHTRKQGDATVKTTYTYDAMGRRKGATQDNVSTGTIASTSNWDLKNRMVTVNHPGGSSTTIRLDGLGRPISAETTTGGAPITDYFAYDLAGNLVVQSDLQVAKTWAYDGHGRLAAAMNPDGTRVTAELDSMAHPKKMVWSSASGTPVGESTFSFTDAGKLQSATTALQNGTRTSQFTWDGAGRRTGMSSGGRAVRAQYDAAGRVMGLTRGAGSAQGISSPFEQSALSNHAGALPRQITSSDRAGSSFQLAMQFNTAAAATSAKIGTLEWSQQTDQAGNPTMVAEPNRPAGTAQYDSRGRLMSESLPGGGTNAFGYDGAGGMNNYTDPASEVTQTATDLLGRPTQRTYVDGTTEKIVWEGRRVQSVTDRAGRLQSFGYDARGRISEIRGATGPALDKIAYDDAGRITSWTNDHSRLEFADYDSEGNAHTTIQKRLQGGAVIDQYRQTHTWDVHGERTAWTMPSYGGLTGAWTASLNLAYDDAGNLTRIERQGFAGGGGVLLDSSYRGQERPERRTVTTAIGAPIVREYQYNGDSLMSGLAVSANGKVVAGSVVTYDGMQKKTAQLLGVSDGARRNEWSYDGRSRLRTSVLGRDPGAVPSADELTAGDFRQSFSRPAATPVDPPSLTFTEGPGHRIGSVQRGAATEQFSYAGGERTGDGRFTYQYDEKGRLITALEKASASATVRRISYFYAGNDRVIGRRAEYAQTDASGQVGTWTLEDRQPILVADQLPADATFVWDPIVDRLVSVFKAGSSENGSIDANGGLLRQIIHGGEGYDDPIEVMAADVVNPANVSRLYPVYDEAGAGSLQVVLDQNAQIVTRSAAGGPYGEDESVLRGLAVDRIFVKGEKNAQGTLEEAQVVLRTTETIRSNSVTTGVRLAVVDADGALVRTSPVAPTATGALVAWSLTNEEWTALTSLDPVVVNGTPRTPAALSIAVTSALRAEGWSSNAPPIPAPAWARATRPVFASVALPVEVRESLTNLNLTFAGIEPDDSATSMLYEVATIGALGAARLGSSGPEQLLLASSFQAAPFQEPLTGKTYLRGRWFDSQTGTWLTPDPRGYSDSSNLYTFGGGDPVNHRDPTGAYEEDVHHYLTTFLARAAGFDDETAELIGWSTQELDMDNRTAMPSLLGIPNPVHGNLNMTAYHMVTPDRLKQLRQWATFWMGQPGLGPRDGPPNRRPEVYRAFIEGNIKWQAVGNYLHALEDSFSHQKGKESRDFTRQFGTWLGHAEWGHTADHTWRRPKLALEMAKRTFEELQDLCTASRSNCSGGKTWTQIEAAVVEFIIYRPQDHGELTWELIDYGPIAHGFIENVLTYQGKINKLGAGYSLDPDEQAHRDKAQQDYLKHRQRYPRGWDFDMRLHREYDTALDKEK